jgi:RNA polymerase sigma-70 factor (ECF subfamily)
MERIEIQRLFRQHYAKMYRVARTILYDEQESEDVISDIFESLLHRQILLLPDTEENYLMTSVRNQCFKRLRHEDVKLQMKERWMAEQTADAGIDDDRLTDIDEFVACHLSAQEQRIFRLRFTDGYSYDEIAVAEGISRIAVWKHLSHVLKEIRNHLKK